MSIFSRFLNFFDVFSQICEDQVLRSYKQLFSILKPNSQETDENFEKSILFKRGLDLDLNLYLCEPFFIFSKTK